MDRKLKCMIVDDEEMATRVIESHLAHVEELELVGIYHSGVEAYLALDQLEVDVLFLDIQMPKMTGLSLLKRRKNPPLTVLTTAHRDYALDGFDLDVVDYLLKPIGIERFLQTVSKLRRLVEGTGDGVPATAPPAVKDHLFVKANRNFVKLFFRDILYVEAIKNHVRISTTEGSYISLISITDFGAKLPAVDFIRVHRSFLINIRRIDTYGAQHIRIRTTDIPIGRSYKEQVRQHLQQKLG